MSIVLNERGTPEPPSEVTTRLKSIHPSLNLRFVEGVSSHWAIELAWGEKDRRWEWVKTGQTDPTGAFDIIGYLPMDCSLNEAPAHIERVFRQFPREDVQSLVDRIAKWNVEPAQKAAEEAFAEVLDSANPSSSGGVGIAVEVSEDIKPAKKKKAAPKKKKAPRKKASRKSKYLD